MRTVDEKEAKTELYQVRLTKADAKLFEEISAETDDTRADVFRKALRLYATVKRNNMGDTFLG